MPELEGYNILVVEDDVALAKEVMTEIEKVGGQAFHVETVQQARNIISENQIDLIVLDRMLADHERGFELIEWFKELEKPMPGILVASRLSTTEDHIEGLELGADDYIDKPFEMREFVSRLKALARRVSTRRSHDTVFVWDDLELRKLNGVALWKNTQIELRPLSYKVLESLAEQRGEHISRKTLWLDVWPHLKALSPQDTVINNAVYRLRKELAAASDQIEILAEEYGYRLVLKAGDES